MYKKVLVAEDMDDINKGVYTMLKEIGVTKIDQVQYCDDAFLKVKKAILDKAPYDLLITDLSFKDDYRTQKYKSGEELVKALYEKNIKMPVIVYSVEDRLQRVRNLIHNYKVNAYVCKGRHGLKDLQKAINNIPNNKPFLSSLVEKAIKTSNNSNIDEYDILLIKKIAEGYTDKEISLYFSQNNITPSSVSSVEKKINKLKDLFRAKNKPHLITLANDSGFI
ncbi:response regulator [uncultured Tenacibaculum sp.]|uniref:response regulator n=1 Tax=uncultured Tenacibaculum sp. TaxID=174713 RepID=UPI002609A61C|nr:response regulator [uncultured Tenacibaculum sp.]